MCCLRPHPNLYGNGQSKFERLPNISDVAALTPAVEDGVSMLNDEKSGKSFWQTSLEIHLGHP